MYDTKPELIGIYNNGVKGGGGGGGTSGSVLPDGRGGLVVTIPMAGVFSFTPISSSVVNVEPEAPQTNG